MSDIKRSLSDLEVLYADNDTGQIDAQDLRDGIKSSFGSYTVSEYNTNFSLTRDDIYVSVDTAGGDISASLPSISASDGSGDTFRNKFYYFNNTGNNILYIIKDDADIATSADKIIEVDNSHILGIVAVSGSNTAWSNITVDIDLKLNDGDNILANDTKFGTSADYVELQKNGTPPKLFNNNSTIPSRLRDSAIGTYSYKDYISQAFYQKLVYGRGAVISWVGDSTSTSYPQVFAERLAQDFPNTQFEYIDVAQIGDPEPDGTQYPPTIYNPAVDKTELMNVQYSVQNSTPDPTTPPFTEDDGAWTESTLEFEVDFSGVTAAMLSANAVEICAKFGDAGKRTFYLDSSTNNLRLYIYTSDNVLYDFNAPGFFTSVVASDFFSMKIQLDLDSGGGDSTATFYTSQDNRQTWDLEATYVRSDVTVKTFQKSTDTAYTICGLTSSALGLNKVHRFAMRNGIDGEYVSTPHTIDNWDFAGDTSQYLTISGMPVCTVCNGSIGGYSYHSTNINIIKNVTIPDPSSLYVINLGLNNYKDPNSYFRSEQALFFASLNAVAKYPSYTVSTQNPKFPYNPEYAGRFNTDQCATMQRDYAYNNNNVALFDQYARIVNTVEDFGQYYVDDIHFGNDMNILVVGWLYNMMSGNKY